MARRQEEVLRRLAARFRPLQPYARPGGEVCSEISQHTRSLVARLELGRRGIDASGEPQDAPVWARHLARAIPRLYGSRMHPGPCAYPKFGGPQLMNAAAALAYALHRYGADWPAEVRESIGAAVSGPSWPEPQELHNLHLAVATAQLLAGEALGRSELWERGKRGFAAMFESTERHGGHELNAPMYSAHHFPSLIFLQELRDQRVRNQARILLEYELLVSAHLYLPGGGLGAPQSRDYGGGAADRGERGMQPVLWLLIGDPELQVDLNRSYDAVIAAATDYRVPEVIRSIFLDKGDGYEFWARHDAHQPRARSPHAVYPLGSHGAQTNPWEAVVLPGGRAMLGVAYGWQQAAVGVSSGLYVRVPSGGFAILYQYQPLVLGDSDDTGRSIRGSGLNDDPDDFRSELYDFERLVYHRSAIALWDPRPRPGVVRTHPDTRVHLPDWKALGGEARRVGPWYLGVLGDVYVAYRPLGTIAGDRPGPGAARILRLQGRSGGISELATRAEFASLDAYAQDIAGRHVSFSIEPLAAEFDARGPDGALERLRLEYRPERRVIGGRKVSEAEFLSHGLMQSPWVSWDEASETLLLRRPGYPEILYDWKHARIDEQG